MLLNVIDANGNQQTIIAQSQGVPADLSGLISATGQSQILLNANAGRSNYFIQNLGTNPMFVNELGVAASETVAPLNGSIMIPPGGSFPPFGYPITTTQINIIGTAGDAFVAREVTG